MADILADRVRGHLVPRLIAVARTELTEVQEILQSVVLTEDDDRRTCPLSTDRQSLQSGPIYHSADDTHSWRPPCCFLQFRVGRTELRRESNSSAGCWCKKGCNAETIFTRKESWMTRSVNSARLLRKPARIYCSTAPLLTKFGPVLDTSQTDAPRAGSGN